MEGSAAKDATGEPDAVDVVQRAHRTMDKIERMTGTVDASAGNRNNTTISFEGGKSVITSLMVGLVAGVCLGLSVAIVGWVSWALNRQDSMNNWTAQEVTAIRSYITNGKLQPMNPRPFGPEQEEKP